MKRSFSSIEPDLSISVFKDSSQNSYFEILKVYSNKMDWFVYLHLFFLIKLLQFHGKINSQGFSSWLDESLMLIHLSVCLTLFHYSTNKQNYNPQFSDENMYFFIALSCLFCFSHDIVNFVHCITTLLYKRENNSSWKS